MFWQGVKPKSGISKNFLVSCWTYNGNNVLQLRLLNWCFMNAIPVQKATKIVGSPMIEKATDKKMYLFWIRPPGALLSNKLENWTWSFRLIKSWRKYIFYKNHYFNRFPYFYVLLRTSKGSPNGNQTCKNLYQIVPAIFVPEVCSLIFFFFFWFYLLWFLIWFNCSKLVNGKASLP